MNSVQNLPDFGELMDHLAQELWWLNHKWNIFRELFGRDEATIDSLNRRAGPIIGVLQRVLLDDLILQMAKVLDPASASVKGGKRWNVTLSALAELLPPDVDPAIRHALANQVEANNLAYQALINHRNRRIAHHDHLVMAQTEQLPGISRKTLSEAMEAIKSTFRALTLTAKNHEYGFLDSRDEADAVDTFLDVLAAGNNAMDAKWERKKADPFKLTMVPNQ